MIKFLKSVLGKVFEVVSKILPLVCVLLVVYCLLQANSLNKRIDLIENRVTTVEQTICSQFDEIQKTLLSINAHLELLDKYASADWEHFYGVQNNINIDSKTKRK